MNNISSQKLYTGEVSDRRRAVILAGGDGKRLLPLTRTLCGDEDRPKQFCRVTGAATLLDQTLRRVAQVASPSHTFSVVNRAHEDYYSGRPAESLLVQPCNKGTGPAIAYSLFRLRALDPDAIVGIFPSDHHFSDDDLFSACMDQAYEFARWHTDAVVLLGVAPDRPETEYGWVEPGERVAEAGPAVVCRVRGFWEKPSGAVAAALMRRGCFWNSFVMVGSVTAFLRLIRRTCPDLYEAFLAIAPALFTKDEAVRLPELYGSLSCSSFAKDMLSARPDSLAVLCSHALGWTDVGDVRRALAVAGGNGSVPHIGVKSAVQQAMELRAAAG